MIKTEQKYNSIFNKDFYPTPKSVIELMGIDCNNMQVLEPSAGKGDLIDWLKEHGAKTIDFCEINKDLADICKNKARLIEYNFLEVKEAQISHIGQIIMNPPFSESKKHILHAWQIAPEGCEIISLCNDATLQNWGNDESSLSYILKNHGNSYYLGDVFNQAERSTNAEISCIKLYKPVTTENTNFEGFYMDAEEEVLSTEGVIKYDEVQSLVNSYIGALKCFDEFELINEKMKRICTPIGMNEGFSYTIGYNKSATTKNEFSKALQIKSWSYIFNKMKMGKYLTSGVMKDINTFCEKQNNVPFTVKNIYKMFEIILGTKDQIFNRALVEVVDNFTERTHENRYGLEGWKTNAGHLLNKKFIVDSFFDLKESYCRNAGKLVCGGYRTYGNDKINDLYKVLCNLTGRDYSTTRNISQLVDDFDGLEPGKWYSNNFFEVKGFKKGTAHFKFTDDKVWEMLNRKYAEIKGNVLPEKI